MALIILSGYPLAGKTTRAEEIKEMLESRLKSDEFKNTPREVVIVNDEQLGINRSVYNDSKSEKVSRGELLSNTIRLLSQNRIILCDGMNYIKGFRYQLYCAAREAGVRNCTVHIAAIPSDCISRNFALPPEANPYLQTTIENLISRFEEPNGSARWDSPLVVFPWCDSLVSNSTGDAKGLAGKLEGLRVVEQSGASPKEITDDEVCEAVSSTGPDVPECFSNPTSQNPQDTLTTKPWSSIANDIWTAVTQNNLKPATAAVKVATRTSTNFLHLLESTTSTIISEVLSNLNQSPNSYGTLTFPIQLAHHSKPKIIKIKIPMGKTINMSALQRLRRQYTTLQKQAGFAGRGHTDTQVEEIIDGFVQYLQGTL
ncbi:hypothetical protein CROQUDRAFT_655583 [Cronartium quercuum f. sp. fusiforme G11]|uniref:Chromatin associated protein KTI12 n=1 Tax=Cronartium quercuum f. sp. fusiforme G11 TaxID=708437 RepID=A0A9P6TCY6_9BASI|nr:hypothetical protein CROQUDRAFT_655583 [Cronartium quercuum f. sp. fusiforme G11]